MTPLAVAAWLGCDQVIKTLVKNHAKINVQDNNGKTPVHRAMDWNHLETVKLLVELGADLHIKDVHRMNALEFANMNALEFANMNALEFANMKGFEEIASFLYNKMAEEKANSSK